MFRSRSKSKKPSEKAIFKKFLDFLQSTMWKLPTSMFIEQNSIVFDRDQLEPSLFKSIHNQFAGIVDSLINAHCEDAKITPADLVEALKSIDKTKKLTAKERILLEPVVAAQDFNVFVPLMMRKNVELQLQALILMKYAMGVVPPAMTLADEDAVLYDMLKDEDECEKFILISVIRKSREDYASGATDYWSEFDGQGQQRSSEEQDILKSLQEHHNQGVDEAILKNLETGLQALILKTGPALPSASSSGTVLGTEVKTPTGMAAGAGGGGGSPPEKSPNRPKTPAKEEKIKDRASTFFPAETIKPRSASVSRPGTAKKGSTTAAAGAAGAGTTITATVDKSTKKGERLKSVDGGKNVQVPGHPGAGDKKRNSISVMDGKSPNGSNGGSNVNSPNPAISPGHTFDYRSLLKEKDHVPDEQLKARTEYLRHQRDKLVELKRVEKEKQLNEQSEKESLERPKTAKAARAAMSQAEARLETRKAIASKLKAQVVDVKK